jgi:hypothetical protein
MRHEAIAFRLYLTINVLKVLVAELLDQWGMEGFKRHIGK